MGTMNAGLIADAEDLLRAAQRLQRVGLVLEREALSPTTRRAAFALQCYFAGSSEKREPKRPPIGFVYPNMR